MLMARRAVVVEHDVGKGIERIKSMMWAAVMRRKENKLASGRVRWCEGLRFLIGTRGAAWGCVSAMFL